jgi:hypothetical protein
MDENVSFRDAFSEEDVELVEGVGDGGPSLTKRLKRPITVGDVPNAFGLNMCNMGKRA